MLKEMKDRKEIAEDGTEMVHFAVNDVDYEMETDPPPGAQTLCRSCVQAVAFACWLPIDGFTRRD